MKRNKSFDNSHPLIYLISTPIGNLKEFSPRALEIINDMDLIAAEDTRNSKQLLANYGIYKDMFSLREHNENEAAEHIISLVKQGKKVAYMSDAGYPGISDPGAILVKKAIQNDISVSTVSGPSAFINALVSSGLPTDHFYFYGFLPAKEGEAKTVLEDLAKRKETVILYEAPHRIEKTIHLLFDAFNDRQIVIARELTKLNEEYIRGSLKEIKEMDFSTIKGELVIIIKGKELEEEIDENKIKERINYFTSKGLSNKDAIEVVAEEYKINKNKIYKIAIEK